MAWLTGWSYRKKLTVDADKVAGALSDFAVLVDIGTDPELVAEVTVSGAGDGSFNGVYELAGIHNGKGYYLKTSGGTRYLCWTADEWEPGWVLHTSLYSWEANMAWYYTPSETLGSGTWYLGDEGWMEDAGPAPSSVVLDEDEIPGTGDDHLAAYANADASDIRFTAADGETLLDYEIETWAADTGRLVASFKAASLSNVTDPEFYLYFGNAEAEDAQSPEDVWDGFEAVYHMSDLTTSTVADSTGVYGGTKAAANKPVEAAGQIDRAQSYGSGSNLKLGTWDPASGGDLTLSAWVFCRSHNYRGLIAKRDTWVTNGCRWKFGILNTGYVDFASPGFGNFNWQLPTGRWVHLAVTHDADGDDVLYADGEVVSTQTAITFGTKANAALVIGASDGTGYEVWDGLIDEVRIAAGVRSAAWIETEYNNQDDPSSFYTLGALETDGGSTTTYTTPGTIQVSHDATAAAEWGTLSWEATLPAGTSIRARTRTASTEAGLAAASWSDWITTSGAAIESDDGRWIEVEFELSTTDTAETPELESGTVTYSTAVELGRESGSVTAAYGVGLRVLDALASAYEVLGGRESGSVTAAYGVGLQTSGDREAAYAAGLRVDGDAAVSAYGVEGYPWGRVRSAYAVIAGAAGSADAAYAVGLRVTGRGRGSYGPGQRTEGSGDGAYAVIATASQAALMMILAEEERVL